MKSKHVLIPFLIDLNLLECKISQTFFKVFVFKPLAVVAEGCDRVRFY